VRPTSLDAWLDWQQKLHPRAMDFGLERVGTVWSRLGAPPLSAPVVTIAGTNGKGSCGAMLESVYRAAGFRTAWYSSPHLLRYVERIRMDGHEVDEATLCAAFDRVETARGDTPLTYFEFGTLAALTIFAGTDLDVVILEVGLGGRLDAVNLIDPDIALITTIARDHTAWLGESLEQIAFEKAGIFRPGRPVVIGHRGPRESLLGRAASLGCELYLLGRDFDWEGDGPNWRWKGPGQTNVSLPSPALRGQFQYDNASAAMMAVSCLAHRLPVAAANIRLGLQQAHIPGRFQVLPGEVPWILDVAHNAQAGEALASNLAALHCAGRVHAVFGVLSDKEPAAIVRPLVSRVQSWYLGQSPDSRALPAEALRAALSTIDLGPDLHQYATIEGALEGAVQAARPGDCILVFGSFTTVEVALRRIRKG
jgi:dihydrofolate synthase / folylpolyglutamate synthase